MNPAEEATEAQLKTKLLELKQVFQDDTEAGVILPMREYGMLLSEKNSAEEALGYKGSDGARQFKLLKSLRGMDFALRAANQILRDGRHSDPLLSLTRSFLDELGNHIQVPEDVRRKVIAEIRHDSLDNPRTFTLRSGKLTPFLSERICSKVKKFTGQDVPDFIRSRVGHGRVVSYS